MYKTTIIGVEARDSYDVHQQIAQYCDGIHHLWRRDGDNVVVVSDTAPTGELRTGMACATTELPSLAVGQRFPVLLRLCACTHSTETGKYTQIKDADLEPWLRKHMPGFRATYIRALRGRDVAEKPGHTVTLGTFEVSAMVEVEDAEAAAQVLRSGVGRARRFGCGLVLVLA